MVHSLQELSPKSNKPINHLKRSQQLLAPSHLCSFPHSLLPNEKNLTCKHARVTFKSSTTPLAPPSIKTSGSPLALRSAPPLYLNEIPLPLPPRTSYNITTAILGFRPISRSSIPLLQDYDITRPYLLWRSQATPIFMSPPPPHHSSYPRVCRQFIRAVQVC